MKRSWIASTVALPSNGGRERMTAGAGAVADAASISRVK